MKKSITILARSLVVATMLLGGAAVSEAAPFQLAAGASTVNLCLTGCGTYGLTDWVAEGIPVTGFEAWLSGTIAIDGGGPTFWSGPLQTLDSNTPLVTHVPGSATATAQFYDESNHVGINLGYELKVIGGVAHILETAVLVNASDWFLRAWLTDGLGNDVVNAYIYPKDPSSGEPYVTDLASIDYTPTPEPMSMVLLGTGLVAVVRSRRRNVAVA